MRMIVLLILSLGAFGAIYGSKCIPETMVCHPYRVKMEPHKNLMESEEELNSWCRQQFLFFSCLEDVLLGKYGNYSELPTNILVSKMFSEDLCLEGSPNRKRYLDNAACINQLDLEYCKLPEYLDIIIPGGSAPPSKCSLAEKYFSCIAATMVIKCGFDAGKLHKYLLKVTNVEEICGVESSEHETCDATSDSGDKVSDVYYGLVHRFGSIPEQVTEASSMFETRSISRLEEAILSEALGKALDAIDYSDELVEAERSRSNEVKRSEDESRKWPVIIEPFRGLLFYNYSNEEFEFYWRQPGSFPVERVTCEHVLTPHIKSVLFECIVQHRPKEPECYYNVKPKTSEKITPELIRDIDRTIPEDSGLAMSESVDLKDYLADYKLHRRSWLYHIFTRYFVAIASTELLNRHLEVEYPNDQVCAREVRFYDIIKGQIPWWKCPSLFSDELRNEVIEFLFGRRTKEDVLFLSVFNDNDTSYVHLFEPLLHAFDKVVCERVNECHPRGRGVFKCSLKRRDLKGCSSCCYVHKSTCNTRPKREEADGKSSLEISNYAELSRAFEHTSVPLGSNVHEGFAEEVTIRSEEESDTVTGVEIEDGEIEALDLLELQSESSSDINNLVFLNRKSEERSENEFLERSGFYEYFG